MTADSNFVLYCFFLPFFLFGAVALLAAMTPVIAPVLLLGCQLFNHWSQPKVVYRTKTVYKDRVVYRDRPATVQPRVQTQKPKKVRTQKPKKTQKGVLHFKKATAPKTQHSSETTPKQVINDVVGGLSNLGFTKKDAKTLVAKVTGRKKYNSTDTLFQDCMSLMSEMRT